MTDKPSLFIPDKHYYTDRQRSLIAWAHLYNKQPFGVDGHNSLELIAKLDKTINQLVSYIQLLRHEAVEAGLDEADIEALGRLPILPSETVPDSQL